MKDLLLPPFSHCTTNPEILKPEELDLPGDFEELALCGLQILAKVVAIAKRSGQKVVMICAPMTTGGQGNLVANMAYHKKAVAYAQAHGIIVFNQEPFERALSRLKDKLGTPGQYPLAILHVFYKTLFGSGMINELWFMPGWEDSTGCYWEYETGRKLRIPCIDYPIQWVHFLKN